MQRLAEHLGGLVTLLRTALDEPAEPPPAERTASGSPKVVQRIPVERAARRWAVTLTVGVDVGGTSVRAGVVDGDGTVLDTARTPTPPSETALETAVAGVVGTLADRHRIAAVGLALAGFITPDRRVVRFAPHLSWRDAPGGRPDLRPHRAARRRRARRQRRGARRALLRGGGGRRTVVFVAFGTGIGSALLLDGVLFRGAFGVAPELGHLQVVPDGRPCPCGKPGAGSATARARRWPRPRSSCWRAIRALAAAVRLAAGDPRRVTGQGVAAAAREGDPVACAAMEDLARWLGVGLALVADVFDPELVVIGGGVSESAPLFLDEAREHYAALLTGAGRRPLARIRTAQLGESAAVVGAAQLARDLVVGARRGPARRAGRPAGGRGPDEAVRGIG